MHPVPLRLAALTLATFLSTEVRGAPEDLNAPGADPERARVAAQCAAFWVGAGHPDRAVGFRALARALAPDPQMARRIETRLTPEMAALARDVASNLPRAVGLHARHAALCAPATP